MIQAKWADYRLFDYERELGRREIAALAGSSTTDADEGVTLDESESLNGATPALVSRLAVRATYFAQLNIGTEAHQQTAQAQAEARHWQLRGAYRRRQATRFSVHGIHEYRGKFNPQMARALVNVVDPDADVLIDPFCGSGTALVEGLRLGLSVVGIDRSPMAHFIAQTKLAAMRHGRPAILKKRFMDLGNATARALAGGQKSRRVLTASSLDSGSADYLARWFTPPAFNAIARALDFLSELPNSVDRDLARIALSAILRETSLQLPEDLRVRRRPPGFVAPPLAERYMEAVEQIAGALEERRAERRPPGSALALLGSADDAALLMRRVPAGRRLVLTSPPYATALPYIDTDRLSILALGLAAPGEVRQLEASLLGSREWNRDEAQKWARALAENTDDLPIALVDMLGGIVEANKLIDAGFRRAAVPALLYRYFALMKHCFTAWTEVLRPGESAVLVVGRNRTGPSESQVVIDTPRLLGAVAEGTDCFGVSEVIALEAWPRYGLHSANGVRGEDAVILMRR